jgi:hypothetical protein
VWTGTTLTHAALDLSSRSPVIAWLPTRPSVHSFMPRARKLSRQSVLDTNTGPSSVANCGLIVVFDIRHPNRPIATIFQVEVKALIMRRDSRDENPHSNN